MKLSLDVEINKKTVIVASGSVAAVTLFFMVTAPLYSKVSTAAGELKALETELTVIRAALESGKAMTKGYSLLSRHEVSRVINEMTKIGTGLNINFLSTSPQRIRKVEGSKYYVLPIRMGIQSTYKDLGVFLGALKNLKQRMVTVKRFTVTTKEEISPDVSTEIVVEIYLKEGASG